MTDSVQDIFNKAEKIWGLHFVRLYNQGKGEREQRYGGCLAVFLDNPPYLVTDNVGAVNLEKKDLYYNSALEKFKRIYEKDPQVAISSWQYDRNPDEGRYGGAIRAGGHILSFSGLPEQYDEIFVILVALGCNLITLSETVKITKHSGNQELLLSYLQSFGLQTIHNC